MSNRIVNTGSIITKNPVNCQCRFAGWLKNFQKSYCSRLGEWVLQSQQCRIQYIPVSIIVINITETVFGFFSVFAGNRTGVIYSVSLIDFFFQREILKPDVELFQLFRIQFFDIIELNGNMIVVAIASSMLLKSREISFHRSGQVERMLQRGTYWQLHRWHPAVLHHTIVP